MTDRRQKKCYGFSFYTGYSIIYVGSRTDSNHGNGTQFIGAILLVVKHMQYYVFCFNGPIKLLFHFINIQS